MDDWLKLLLTVACSVAASSGFWAFVQQKDTKKSAQTQMLIGLGHDRIVNLGMSYIERNSITQDEYENLYTYLYLPYKKLGGNGTAERIMEEVKKLHITPSAALSS